MGFWIGVDMGGTTTTLAIANDAREVIHIGAQFKTRSQEGPTVVVGDIVAGIRAAIADLGGDLSDVQGACIATPGPATLDGTLLKSPNLDPQQWDRFPIRAAIEEALAEEGAIQVRYLGDGQAAALGEFSLRSGLLTCPALGALPTNPELASLYMLIVGTGLGGGAVEDGKCIRGSQGRAGHGGHVFLPPEAFRYEHDRNLLVGNAYCTAESAVSLTSLTHQLGYRLSLDTWKSHPLRDAAGTLRDKAKQLRGLAAQGDELSIELFDDQARALGIAFLVANYIGDFDLLVIGGGVCDLAPQLRDRYRRLAIQAYEDHALEGFRPAPTLEYSACGDNAPVIGALATIVPV